ncbi:hypothetical protein QBC40DRAFT_155525, partial [Triangularia verruculosa]
RTILPIAGGNIRGPLLNATICTFRGGWALGDRLQGDLYSDICRQLLTGDGADFIVGANGRQQVGGVIHCRVRNEAGVDKGYRWVNGVVVAG